MVFLLFVYLIIINFVSFFIYGLDKQKAQRHMWRISESGLIFLALIGGSIGALWAMLYFRHKTKKDKFRIGVPVILIIQVFLLCHYVL